MNILTSAQVNKDLRFFKTIAKKNLTKRTQDNTLHSRLMMQGSNNDSDLILQNGLKDLFDK